MKNILKIVTISKPLHKILFLIGGLIVASALLDLAPPILSKFIVDEIVRKVQNHGGNLNFLIMLIALGFILSSISTVLDSVSERIGDHFAGELNKFLTEKFYDKILRLPQNYFDSEISGKIVNQLNRAQSSIANFLNSATNFILPSFLQSILTIAVLAYYNPPIAFFVVLLFPIYFTLTLYSSKKWGEAEVQKNQIQDQFKGRIQEVVGNIKLVKSFNNEKNEFGFVSSKITEINKIYAKQSSTFHIFDYIRHFSLDVIILLINIIAFVETFQGHLTIGTLILIVQMVNQARRPLFSMSFILTNVQNAEAGSKEYLEILELPAVEDYRAQPPKERLKNPDIEFKSVSFNYKESERVLDQVSFKISPKENVALVGHSGAGKTTIVNLILKFYEPTSGQILLNGENYKQLSHQVIRSNIALVFQESGLFSTSIRENVAYGNIQSNEEDIIEALKKANAYDFVMKFPHGIETEVGERGIKLSGGQKQRIQIARAILKNSPILILDEATSSLDAKSEKEVHEALDALMKDRLVIIIAHRFSTIQNVDKILVIDEGKIVESGNPQELSKKPGVYSELLHYQIEGNRKLLEKFEIY